MSKNRVTATIDRLACQRSKIINTFRLYKYFATKIGKCDNLITQQRISLRLSAVWICGAYINKYEGNLSK